MQPAGDMIDEWATNAMASSIGTIIEFCDFAVFGTGSAQIFG